MFIKIQAVSMIEEMTPMGKCYQVWVTFIDTSKHEQRICVCQTFKERGKQARREAEAVYQSYGVFME